MSEPDYDDFCERHRAAGFSEEETDAAWDTGVDLTKDPAGLIKARAALDFKLGNCSKQ